MTTKTFRGLLAATAVAAILAVPVAAQAQTKTLSSGVSKQLVIVQDAMKKAPPDLATAKTAIDAAGQVSGRTDYDNYTIANFAMIVDVRLNDMAGASAAAQVMADSPAQPDADKPTNQKNAMILTLQNKQFDKALTYAKALAATNPTDPSVLSNIAQAYYFAKDFPDAQIIAQKQVDAAIAAHQKPDRNTLDILMSSQASAKDEAGAEKTLELLVANYNDPKDWTQIIDVTFGLKGMRDVDFIWLGRLLFVCGAQVSAADASLVGGDASHLTFYGDAVTAKQKGGTGFPDPTASAAKDKASMPAQIAAGQKQGGQYNAKLAEALYGYGMYPEAVAAAQLAMQKGGATDASEAPMVLAQAQIAQGKFDDGLATLGQISGGGPVTGRVVQLWKDYATIQKNPPATAAAH